MCTCIIHKQLTNYLHAKKHSQKTLGTYRKPSSLSWLVRSPAPHTPQHKLHVQPTQTKLPQPIRSKRPTRCCTHYSIEKLLLNPALPYTTRQHPRVSLAHYPARFFASATAAAGSNKSRARHANYTHSDTHSQVSGMNERASDY